MASAAIGESNLVFGTTDDTWGLIQNLTYSDTSQVTEAMDADGDILGAAFHGNRIDVSGTYLFKADLNSPLAHVGDGVAITLSDADTPGSIFINSATNSVTNTEFKSIDFDGTFYPNLGS